MNVVTALTAFLVALVGALSATELVRVAAIRWHAVDNPGGRRMHRRVTPRLGGIGIAWGFGVSLVFLRLVTAAGAPLAGEPAAMGALLGSAALLALVGHADDRRSLPSLVKLAACVAAALVLWSGGWRVESLGLPGLGAWSVGMWSLPLTVAWVVFVTNAINLIDGLDGLATGLGFIACMAIVALPGTSAPDRQLALALAGALLGFLWFNLHPALIFMGDAGSLFVGLVLSALLLHAPSGAVSGWFPLAPVLLLAVPLGDTTHAIVRRLGAAAVQARTWSEFAWTAPRRVFTPDRGHVHHQLQLAGFAPRRAAALLWGAGASFACVAWCAARHPGVAAVLWVFLLSAWSWVGWRVRLRRVRSTATPQLPATPSHDEDVPASPARAA